VHLLWDTQSASTGGGAAPAVQRRSLKRSSQDCRLASTWPLEPSPHRRHTVHVTARPTECAGAEPPQQPGCWVQTQSLQPNKSSAEQRNKSRCVVHDQTLSTLTPPRPTADARYTSACAQTAAPSRDVRWAHEFVPCPLMPPAAMAVSPAWQPALRLEISALWKLESCIKQKTREPISPSPV
jgi:hypothetical protein